MNNDLFLIDKSIPATIKSFRYSDVDEFFTSLSKATDKKLFKDVFEKITKRINDGFKTDILMHSPSYLSDKIHITVIDSGKFTCCDDIIVVDRTTFIMNALQSSRGSIIDLISFMNNLK